MNDEYYSPKINEIVTVFGFSKEYHGNIYISEYLKHSSGVKQSFKSFRLRKLDHSFGKKICAEILESIKVTELQLNYKDYENN